MLGTLLFPILLRSAEQYAFPPPCGGTALRFAAFHSPANPEHRQVVFMDEDKLVFFQHELAPNLEHVEIKGLVWIILSQSVVCICKA